MAVHLKTPAEIELIRKAGKIAATILEQLSLLVKPGTTTLELDSAACQLMKEYQVTSATLNYLGFPASICTSLNHVVCHGIPSQRKLKSNDILNIDITVIKDGWHGDTSRMFTVGKPPIIAKRLLRVTQECLDLAISIIKPGAYLGDIGEVITRHAQSHKFSVVSEYCGHGIGQNFHEEPQVLHNAQPDRGIQLEEGMVFTIEPMINQGNEDVKVLKDGWTVVTRDRKLSAQYEHTIAVTATGADILTLLPDNI